MLKENYMPHVYKDACRLEKQDKIGDKGCVALVNFYTDLSQPEAWREGEKAFGNRHIAQGTAIATFEDANWPALGNGNHAGFYLGQVADGIYIMDQWPDAFQKPLISMHFLHRLGKDEHGKYIDPARNADAYCVIE
jgi:hypothetical protein